MKRKWMFLVSVLLLVLLITACNPTVEPPVETDQSPVIHGAVDRTIDRGSVFVPLQGITATDDEDGNLTGSITYSGNVNPNVAGIYQATYTVTDSAGNVTSVTVVITVRVVDTEAPLISGAGDITISVGEPGFTILGGVSANDTIDGELTNQITYTGSVNPWVPGVYNVTYRVSDTAGNEAVRARVVTVSLGYFSFGATNGLQNGTFDENSTGWSVINGTASVTGGVVSINVTGAATFSQTGITGGNMNTSVANYTLAKLVVRAKASAPRDIQATINEAQTTPLPIQLTTTMTEYTQYFRMSHLFNNATLTFNLGSAAGTVEFDSIELFYGVPSDDIAPVLTVPTTEVFAPVSSLEALRSLVLRGVSATDNIDGNITSRIMLDLDGIDINVAGTYQIPIKVSDNAGNETEVMRTVHLNLAFDTDVIKDPAFGSELDANQWGLSGGGDQVTMYTQDGMLVLDVVAPGGWDSATSPYLRNVTTNQLLPNNWYMFKFDVRAEKNRQMRIRAGLELWSDPWIEDFLDGAVRNLQYQVTTEWQTIYYVFYIDAATSSAGSNVIKFEIKLGTITWGSEESNNKIFIDNAQFYLLTMEDDDPVISAVADKQLTFGAGAVAPDWKTYVTIFDKEDGNIAVTDAMVNASAVDMNVPGVYPVVYTVTDSGNNTVSFTINITIIESADEEAPVITVVDTLRTTFDQFEDVTVVLTDYITAVDNVDGTITVTNAMVNAGGFSLNTAGTFTVTYTVTDSSGNVATKEIVFTVNDKQAPVISGAKDLTISVGDVYNPLEGITAVDNIDGPITLTLDNVSGHELFLDQDGKASVAGEFEVTYTVTDANNNSREVKITVTVLQIEFDETKQTNLLALQIPVQNDGGTIESVGVYNPDGSLTVTYNGVKGWYGSYSKITYPSVNLLPDRMYKLVIEAKAETARDILVRFVGADNTAVSIFAGRLIVGLTNEFAVYEFIFSLDKEGPYNVQLQFGWEGNLNNVTNTNVIDIKQFTLIPEYIIEYDEANAADLLSQALAVGNDGGTIESVGVYNPDGSLTVTYNGVKGWYGSYSKITYYQAMTEGLNYKLIIEGKAQTERDILIRFVDGSGVAVPGFEGRKIVRLGTEFGQTVVEFKAPSTGTFNLQLQFGWEGNLLNVTDANVIDIKTFKLVPENLMS